MYKLNMVWAKIEDIIPNHLNPRQDYSIGTEKMQRVIREKGWESGITCYLRDTKYIILSGHRRWYAAVRLGITKIPIILIEQPKSKEDELERLGSVQSGKVDWSIYEWAKYTYEMWIIWEKCSFQELAKKMGVSNTQISLRVKVFNYYQHSDIEEKLANGVYTLSALYHLISWLDKLEKFKSDVVHTFDKNLIRATMLWKIEHNIVTVSDLKNEFLVRSLNNEQIKNFLVDRNLKLSAILENKNTKVSKLRTNQIRIQKAVVQINKIEVKDTCEAKDILGNLNTLKAEIMIKKNQLKEFLN